VLENLGVTQTFASRNRTSEWLERLEALRWAALFYFGVGVQGPDAGLADEEQHAGRQR
jgi:hypothetical protein